MEVKSTRGRSIKDLPESKPLVVSSNWLELTRALSAVGDYFVHSEVVQDAPRSGRILLQQPTKLSVTLSGMLTPKQVALELGKLVSVARYNPPEQPPSLYEKGFEIQKIMVDGVPAALVWAAWVRKLS